MSDYSTDSDIVYGRKASWMGGLSQILSGGLGSRWAQIQQCEVAMGCHLTLLHCSFVPVCVHLLLTYMLLYGLSLIFYKLYTCNALTSHIRKS